MLAASQGLVDIWDITESIATWETLGNRFHEPVSAILSAPGDIITVQLLDNMLD
jgi:hypothetical protein